MFKTPARKKIVNSDLSGLTSICSLRKALNSTQNIETISKFNSSYHKCDCFTNKPTQNPQSPKKIQCSTIVNQLLKIVKYYYQDNEIGFLMRARNFLKDGWQNIKKELNVHLNKILYIEKSMYKKSFMEIQSQILKEWKKSPLLYNLRLQWYESMTSYKFETFPEILTQYSKFTEFIGQITYIYFKGFFTVISTKMNQPVPTRLVNRTSHFIVTQSNSWAKLYKKHLQKLIISKINTEKIKMEEEFDFSVLGISPYALNIKSEENSMPKTTQKIDQFIKQNAIYNKMLLLIEVRNTMEQEIIAWQNYLMEQGQLSQTKILDKDDFIGCLIYAVIKGKISLKDLGRSTKYFQLFLSQESSNILSKWECDSYLADLESVYEHLISLQGKSTTQESD